MHKNIFDSKSVKYGYKLKVKEDTLSNLGQEILKEKDVCFSNKIIN